VPCQVCTPELMGLRDSYSISTIGSGEVKVNTQQSNGEKVVHRCVICSY